MPIRRLENAEWRQDGDPVTMITRRKDFKKKAHTNKDVGQLYGDPTGSSWTGRITILGKEYRIYAEYVQTPENMDGWLELSFLGDGEELFGNQIRIGRTGDKMFAGFIYYPHHLRSDEDGERGVFKFEWLIPGRKYGNRQMVAFRIRRGVRLG